MKQILIFKDKFILIGWITGLILIILLFLFLTQNLQTRNLMRTINNIFISKEDVRRVSSFIPQRKGSATLMGYWYGFHNSEERLFVFTVFQDGILIPLGAVVSNDGIVSEIIPLSSHAQQVFDKLPQSIIDMHVRRIETEGRR